MDGASEHSATEEKPAGDLQESEREEPQLVQLETEEERAEKAEKAKIKGNELYADGQYREALSSYTQAINWILGTENEKLKSALSIYYSNRAACNLQLVILHGPQISFLILPKGAHAEVVVDASAALTINPTYTKALLRRAQAQESLGKLNEALKG